MFIKISIIIAAYLIGSIPTALLYSKLAHGRDIRTIGSRNMGARNTKQQFGVWAGLMVAVVDITKGALAVLLAMAFKLPFIYQMAAGTAAVLGHDFSIFAQFRGGKGLATTGGVFLALFPLPALIGLVLQIVIYLIFKNWDLGSGICMGVFVLIVFLSGEPFISIGLIISLLLFIPFKKWLDNPHKEKIQEQGSLDENLY